MPTGPSYERDFYAWTRYQAKVLRSLETDDPRYDREHVAEEIESLGIMERAAVRARVRQILKGFLCLMHSQGDRAKYRWHGEIMDARHTLADKISPTLRRDVRRRLPILYHAARTLAELSLLGECQPSAATLLPKTCPFTIKDVLRDDWYPQQMETIR